MNVIGRRLAHYEILSKLGEGGMGVVYKARDTHLDRFVAIKLLPPEFVSDPERKRRFTQEAKAASALNHPSIVTIHDITQADGTDFIAMEYVRGKTLGELIGRKGLGLKETLNYSMQAASALAKAHAAGIVHRDLKPSNIMVTDDGHVKILDFGVAKLTSADAGDGEEAQGTSAPTRTAYDQPRTEAGNIVGTVAYMSPEQAEGKKVDARSDIFSFGAVLYEMVTGTRAFQSTSSVVTLSAVINEEPKPPSQLAKDLPRDLERVILRCLRKDPARRVQFMADLAVELEEIKSESGTQIAAAQEPARKWRRRWLIASALVTLLLAAGAWLFWPKPAAGLPPPTVVPLTSLPGDERQPTLSPDGNQVAFQWSGEKSDNWDIYIMSVGTGTPLRLTTDPAYDYAPAWSPDGSQIAFMRRQGEKDAVYLTPPVPGSEHKLTEVDDLHPDNGRATVSWFPDGKQLVVRDGDRRMDGIVTIPVDHGDPNRLIETPTSAGQYNYPAVSPTANALAYSRCLGAFNCDVYVSELAEDLTVRGAPRRLTRQNSRVDGIAWTADGRSLIYSSGPYTKPYLWRMSVGGGQPERLELAGARATVPTISGASHTLAYMRGGGDADIWKFEASGPPQTFLSSTLDERNPQFSPDGTRIAFESNRLGKDSQLWMANADGTNRIPLNEGAKGVQGSPRWSPDSRSLVFDGQDEIGQQAVYVVNAAGGQPHRVASPGNLPSWSHDSKWIYFGVRRTDRSTSAIWRVPAAGGDAVQIADAGSVTYPNPLESPDGKTLYYKRAGAASAMLFAKPVGGGPEHQILDSFWPGEDHQYFPVADGIYYVARPDPKLPFAFELRFLNFTTGKHQTLHRFETRFGTGLSVSPDRKTILYSGVPMSAGADLMLIRNFR